MDDKEPPDYSDGSWFSVIYDAMNFFISVVAVVPFFSHADL